MKKNSNGNIKKSSVKFKIFLHGSLSLISILFTGFILIYTIASAVFTTANNTPTWLLVVGFPLLIMGVFIGRFNLFFILMFGSVIYYLIFLWIFYVIKEILNTLTTLSAR